jgi:hypothetical protein
MKKQKLCLVLIVLACVSHAVAAKAPLKRIKLYSPRASGGYDEGKAGFNFKAGARKEDAKGKWDLGYGFAAINYEDWFILWSSNETRTVIKDLGAFKWTDKFQIPVLEPLPKLPKGESRQIVVDASADTGKKWERTTNIMAKVVVGHIYLLRVKNDKSDFYALFRVEDLEQGQHCTITWKRIAAPKQRKPVV